MPSDRNAVLRQVVCPFCSLLCDDLVVKRSGQKLQILENGCPRALRGFESAAPAPSCLVHGKPVTLERAADHAAAILRDCRQPLIAGMGTDVNGCRAALALAERCGAAIDHLHGAAMQNNLRVLQSSGWMMTTLAELKNRADVVVLVGTDTVNDFPRFLERFIHSRNSLVSHPKNSRKLIYIGDTHNPAGKQAPGQPLNVNCKERELSDVLGALRAILQGGQPQQSRHMSRRRLTQLGHLAEVLQAARYGVFVWAPGRLARHYGELIVRDIVDIVIRLNEHTRFSGLSLGGSDGGMTFQNVCTWQTGFPPPVCFADGTAAYDPGLYRAEMMIESGAADALLWLSCFDASRTPLALDVPTILVGNASRRHAVDVEVYIPAGVPGLDHDGNLFRTDSVVSLPLRRLRQADTRPAADVLDLIRKCI